MPELPEVETVKNGIEPFFLQASIQSITINRYDLRGSIPSDFADRFAQTSIKALERRGKYIVMHADNGFVIVLHLGMSGRMKTILPDADYAPAKHDHVVFHLSSGARVILETRADSVCFTMIRMLSGKIMHPLRPWGQSLWATACQDLFYLMPCAARHHRSKQPY